MGKQILVASCDPKGGILRFSLSEDGKLRLTGRMPLDRPMYLCAEGNTLYVLLREAFGQQSGVAKFRMDPDGTLTQQGAVCPTHGSISCHILAFAGHVYTANYKSGSVTRLPDRIVTYAGRGATPQQDGSHPHCLTPSPDGKYICICDLGTDRIYICTGELEEVSRISVEAGSGPRHLVFSEDGQTAFCVNELSSEVSIFGYEDGRLTLLGSERCIPEDYIGDNYPSAIRLGSGGRMLYAANRGHDSVCIWDVEGASLSGRRLIGSGGKTPREMNVVRPWVLCGNSDCLTVVSEQTGAVADRVMIRNPWCILPVDM